MGLVGRNCFTSVGNVQTGHKHLPYLLLQKCVCRVYSVTVRAEIQKQTRVNMNVNVVLAKGWQVLVITQKQLF